MRDFDNEDIMNSAEQYLEIGKNAVLGIDGGYDTLKSILTIELKENANLLIVGGGGGREILSLKTVSENWNFKVVEPSKKMIGFTEYFVAKENLENQVELLNGYLSEFKFDDNLFDAVTCLAVFHYLEKKERKEILDTIKSVLKPNGVFIYSVAFEPETETELNVLRKMYFNFSVQNNVDKSIVNKVEEVFENDYIMLNEKEEMEMISNAGFGKPILLYSSLFFKTYMIRNKYQNK